MVTHSEVAQPAIWGGDGEEAEGRFYGAGRASGGWLESRKQDQDPALILDPSPIPAQPEVVPGYSDLHHQVWCHRSKKSQFY